MIRYTVLTGLIALCTYTGYLYGYNVGVVESEGALGKSLYTCISAMVEKLKK